MASPIETFPAFLEGWLERKQLLLNQLRCFSSPPQPHDAVDAVKDDNHSAIIDHVLTHFQEFYEEKVKATEEDVFLVLHPPWFTPIERVVLWISWFKPSLVLRLAENSVGELMTEEQKQRMEVLKQETKMEESDVDDQFARVQASMSSAPVFNLLRMRRRLVNGEISKLEKVMDALKGSMRRVVASADVVRSMTVRKVMKLLSVEQAIMFLAEVNHYQIHMRRLGSQRGAQRAN